MSNLLDKYLTNPPAKITPTPINNRKKINACAILGSAAGIVAATYGIYSSAKKGNPNLTLNNLTYEEKDALIIGAGSVLGGLAGGLLGDDNKDNTKSKLREATQQFIGNMVFPIGILAGTNTVLKKNNITNPVIKAVTTIASIVGGMHLGNEVMNAINDKVLNEKVKHEVKPEDYFVHVDDICLTANMFLKDIPSISSVTSKLLPASFIIAGTKTGAATKE